MCRPNSDDLVAAMPAGPLKRRNLQLLRECGFHSIQSAVNSIRRPRTSVYVLPGRYTERRWATKQRSDYCSHLETSSDDPTGPRSGSASPPRCACGPGGRD